MDTNKDIDLIEKYLNGELTDTEMQGLDNRLVEDADLDVELQRRQTAHTALDYMVAKNLKAQLQDLEEQSNVVSINRGRRKRLMVLSVAASVLVLAVAVYFIFPQGPMTNPELASAYYELPDYNSRGANDALSEQAALDAGISALQDNNTAEAISKLSTITSDNPYFILAQYYLGHALYADGQFDQAVERFAIVGNSNDLRYSEEAQWYELLSCLAQDVDCSQLLNNLTEDENHTYNNLAKEINERAK